MSQSVKIPQLHDQQPGLAEAAQCDITQQLCAASSPLLGCLTLLLSGRQGDLGGVAEIFWGPDHSRGWLDSYLLLVSSSDMQFQTQCRNHLQYCC